MQIMIKSIKKKGEKMKKNQIYTRKRHEALAKSLEKYIKLQKNMNNFSGGISGAVGLAESFLLISAYTKFGEAASVFFLYVFMVLDTALVAGVPFLFEMKIFQKIASCFPETGKLTIYGRNDLARDILKIMSDSERSPEQAYLECRKKIYLSIDPKNRLNFKEQKAQKISARKRTEMFLENNNIPLLITDKEEKNEEIHS